MQTPELTTWQINSYYTLIIATIVLLFGRYLVRKYRFLQDFNIPEPIAGGLVAAVIIYALYLLTTSVSPSTNRCAKPSCWFSSPLLVLAPISPA